jgi:ribonuclease VapC
VIVVDSSAIIAIAFDEEEADDFFAVLTSAEECLCSPVTFAECAMVLVGKRASTPPAAIDALFNTLNVKQSVMDGEHGRLATEAFLRFGKGRHPAKLNLGDCFSYALAKSLNAPLLYKGDDFARTDIASAATLGARP